MSVRRKLFGPTSFAPSVHSISLDLLEADGARAIVVDLDNTLVGYRNAAPALEVHEWIRGALGRGFKVAMVTNNASPWANGVAAGLGIPCVLAARKPRSRGFLTALEVLGAEREETVVIGDQLFTDVLGAKLLGLRVILTEPIVAREQWWMRLVRLAERLMIPRLPRS